MVSRKNGCAALFKPESLGCLRSGREPGRTGLIDQSEGLMEVSWPSLLLSQESFHSIPASCFSSFGLNLAFLEWGMLPSLPVQPIPLMSGTCCQKGQPEIKPP